MESDENSVVLEKQQAKQTHKICSFRNGLIAVGVVSIGLIVILLLVVLIGGGGNSSGGGSDNPFFALGNTTQTNASLAQVSRFLPEPYAAEYSRDNTMKKTTVLDLFFQGNMSIYTNMLNQTLSKTDTNHDGEIGTDEVKSLLRKQMGFFRYAVFTLGSGKSKLVDEMKAASHNGDGKFSIQGIKDLLNDTKVQDATILIPDKYTLVCDAVAATLDNCTNIPTNVQEQLNAAAVSQMQLCRSGFSWIIDKFEVEKCLLQNLLPVHNATCSDQMVNCLLKAKASPDILSILDPSTTRYPNLQKRDVLPYPGPTFPYTIFSAGGGVVALVAGAMLVSASLAAGVAAVVTSGHDQKYWHENSNFEKWMIGNQELPCNTPFIYWSQQCGALHSLSAQTCVRGVPYTKGACRWGWGGAARQCKLVGCKPLCMDVSTNKCGQDTNILKLGYNANGVGTVLPQQ